MKHVVSVSLGSSSRNHSTTVQLLGQDVFVERIGTDGSRARVLDAIRAHDGQVDAFGMGGIDRYIYVADKRYTFREAEVIARAARQSPILDGSGLKNSLERQVVHELADHPLVRLRERKVLLVSAVDRFGMAEALYEIGCDVCYGDLMFGLGVAVPLRSLAALRRVARVLAPMVTQLPIRYLYPTGEKQQQIASKFGAQYQWADVIAGDFHFIRRHLPEALPGKIILTNTVTPNDVALLRARGVAALITTTPDLGGRSFGTNVLEALLVAVTEMKEGLRPEEYLNLMREIGFRTRLEVF